MNATATATQTAHKAQRGPTCACGKRDYCDNSCNTYRMPARTAYPMPAEDESFSDWQDRRTSNGGR